MIIISRFWSLLGHPLPVCDLYQEPGVAYMGFLSCFLKHLGLLSTHLPPKDGVNPIEPGKVESILSD